jgi:hypothetical protein
MDDRPVIHLLQTDLAMSLETSLCHCMSPPPPTAEDSTTHSTCSSPHVKIHFSSSSTSEALSGVESGVEHSLELWK